MARVAICPSKISAVELRALCATVLDAVEAYFQNPENQRQFEEWKMKREKEECDKCLKSK